MKTVKIILRIIVGAWFLYGFVIAFHMYHLHNIQEKDPFVWAQTYDIWLISLMLVPTLIGAVVECIVFWAAFFAIAATVVFYGLGTIVGSIKFIFIGEFEIEDSFDIWNIFR